MMAAQTPDTTATLSDPTADTYGSVTEERFVPTDTNFEELDLMHGQRPPLPPEARGKFKGRLACDILLALLALGAGAAAWWTRRTLLQAQAATHAELDNLHHNMQQLANEASDQIAVLQQRVATLEQRQAHPLPTKSVATSEPTEPRQTQPTTLYLAKADENGRFTRVSRQFELGNSLFALTTTDGEHGSFAVIDHRDVHRFALMMPTENLTRACEGQSIQVSAGMTRIVTDREGEALCERGQWRVVTKALIHYEA